MDDHRNSINRRALFCDETEDYRIPPEPEEGQLVRLRFRTARNLSLIHIFSLERNQLKLKYWMYRKP